MPREPIGRSGATHSRSSDGLEGGNGSRLQGNSVLASPLDSADRASVLGALDEIRSEPPAANYAGVGCVMALPGFVLLLLFPMIGRMLGLGRGIATVVLVFGAILLVVGLILWFTAGSLTRGRSVAAAEAALRTLEAGEEDKEVLLRAATLLLCNAYATQGPSTVQSMDFTAARGRLGGRLDMVLAVEDLLLEQEAIYPVFTEDESTDETPTGQ